MDEPIGMIMARFGTDLIKLMPGGNFVWCGESDPHNVFPLPEAIAYAAVMGQAEGIKRQSHDAAAGRMKLKPEQLDGTVQMVGARAYEDCGGNFRIAGGEAVFTTKTGREYLRCNFATLALRHIEAVDELARLGKSR